ncbi:MAG TPA: pseudouridine synthase, partial [Steroidobacteraceae bacterium]|nr:pseudouridine synthase [Steroidobacteraceae bacterium]
RVDVPLNTETRRGGERTVRVQAGGKSAVSIFTPVQFFRNRASLVEVELKTGRTHQIRVHAAHVGHPVAGDEKYGDPDFNARMREQGLRRMFLHSHRISFDWPQGGDFSASAPLPADLAAVIDALGESTSLRGSRRRR